jgi:hypothetical protein
MGVAVEILFLGAVVPEICLGSFLTPPPMVLRVCEIGTGLRGLRKTESRIRKLNRAKLNEAAASRIMCIEC